MEVDPRFYSFRWLSLLCSQEFPLPDVLRLWVRGASLLRNAHRSVIVLSAPCSMLHVPLGLALCGPGAFFLPGVLLLRNAYVTKTSVGLSAAVCSSAAVHQQVYSRASAWNGLCGHS